MQSSITLKNQVCFITYLIFVLLLPCCASKSPWSTQSIDAGNAAYNSTRLLYHSSDKLHGIDLELLKTAQSSQLYLTVRRHTIPPYQGDPKQAEIVLTIEGKKSTVIAARHEGGQRVLLPEATRDAILAALTKGHSVHIATRGFSTQLTADHFLENHKEWEHPSPLTNPIHLPF